MSTGHPSVVDNLALAKDGVPDLEGALAASGLRAALTVPLRRGLEMMGALIFASRSAAAYGADDVQIATLIAAGLSSALESSRVYQALAMSVEPTQEAAPSCCATSWSRAARS